MAQGLKIVPMGRPEQIDFLAGKAIFEAYLPNGQGSR